MDVPALLQATAHRPWPLPTGPWAMTQIWHNLLFAHWPLPPAMLQPLIPPPFELDTFAGEAWVGVVPFRMSGIQLRHMPPIPSTDRFPELNLRTYVTHQGKAGVFFFSLDAASFMAVVSARLWFNLPYFYARMSLIETDSTLRYHSRRIHPAAAPAQFIGSYRPTAEVRPAEAGSLAQWLTERYCLYTLDRHGQPYRGDIHHLPWPLQTAEAELHENSIAAAHNLHLPAGPPLLHYADRLEVLIWPLKRLI